MNNYNLYGDFVLKQTLSNEEQHQLFKLVKIDDEIAKNKVFEHNVRLVTFVINRYYKNLDIENQKEIFSVGCLQLWKCIKKFNPDLNIEFSTYAVPSILGSIKRYIRENTSIYIPRRIKDLSVSILNFENEHQNELCDSKTYYNELAKIFDASPEDIILAQRVNLPIHSLQSPIRETDGTELLIEETISDPNSTVYENLENKEKYLDLIKTLDILPSRQKQVLTLLFGLGVEKKNQTEVAKLLNLSQTQISRIKIAALKTLKEKLPEYIKEEYDTKKYTLQNKNN